MLRAATTVLFLVLVAGCGGAHVERASKGSVAGAERLQRLTRPGVAARIRPRECTTQGDNSSGHSIALPAGYRVCNSSKGYLHSTIERLDARGNWHRVTGPPRLQPFDDGQWMNILPSPDGKTLLAQWGGGCEVPNAFFVAAGGGQPRTVTGEKDMRNAPMSIGLDWQSDGRARVAVLNSGCSADFKRPGVYLIDPASGRGTFVRRLPPAGG